MIYRYIVNREELADDQLESLGNTNEVMSEYSPADFKKFYCADCIFQNGNVYPLQQRAFLLESEIRK